MSIIRNKKIAARLAGGAVAAGLILGAPALATLAAAPASADSGIFFENDDFGFAANDEGVLFGNRNGDGFGISDDGFGVRVGGLEVGFED